MSPSYRVFLTAYNAAALTVTAFQSKPQQPHISFPSCGQQRLPPQPTHPRSADVSLAYFPYEEQYAEPSYNTRTAYRPSSQKHPLFSMTVEQALNQAVDVDVVVEDADEGDEWIPDRERFTADAKFKQGEVIDFDPEQPVSKPLRSAAPPEEVYEHDHENYFQKNNGPPNSQSEFRRGLSKNSKNDPIEDVDCNENYFSQRTVGPSSSQYQQQQQQQHRRRGGPSVYTFEEEELINAMGGRSHRPNTQEFSGTNTKIPGGGRDPFFEGNNNNANNFPEGNQFYREDGFLGDSTLKEIAMDYSVPICYLADVVAGWGVPVPIDPLGRLGDMVTGEQAFSMLEAIHTLDIAALHERYSEDNLVNICDFYDIDLKEAFDFAMTRGWALPFGVRTFLRVEQEEELLEALGGDMY